MPIPANVATFPPCRRCHGWASRGDGAPGFSLMTLITMPTIKKILSPNGRRLRNGVFPLGSSPLATNARARLSAFSAHLDAVRRDERMTPLEKDHQARQIINSFKADWSRVVQKADIEYADVTHAVNKLDEQVRQLEGRLTPLDIRRIERVAATLETMSSDERSADFKAAFDAKNSDRLLAHGLLDGSGQGTRRALSILVDPERFQFVLEHGQDAAATRSVAKVVATAVDELETVEDAWREARLDGKDLIHYANVGARAVADVDGDVGLLPVAFAPLVVPPRWAKHQPPEQQQPQQSAPPAGASA